MIVDQCRHNGTRTGKDNLQLRLDQRVFAFEIRQILYPVQASGYFSLREFTQYLHVEG